MAVHEEQPQHIEEITPETQEMTLELLQYVPLFLKGPGRRIGEFAQGETALLRQLYTADETVTPTKLSKTLGISTARIATILKGLEKKGYIVRINDAQDGRRIQVKITPSGRAYVDQARTEVTEQAMAFMEAIGPEDSRDLVRIMKHVYDMVTEWEDMLKKAGSSIAEAIDNADY